ncbi:transketolase, partial [Escherichia coli]
TAKPSLIVLRTVIGWPAPTKQGTGKIHGSKLGADEVAAVKELLGFDPQQSFQVDDAVIEYTRGNAAARAAAAREAWQQRFDAWATANPGRRALLDRLLSGAQPEGVADALRTFEGGTEGSTRAASGKVLNALADVIPELWGGSADLA